MMPTRHVLEGRDSEVAVRSMRASLTAAQTEKAALSSALQTAKADAQSAVASARKSGFAAGRRSRSLMPRASVEDQMPPREVGATSGHVRRQLTARMMREMRDQMRVNGRESIARFSVVDAPVSSVDRETFDSMMKGSEA